MLTRTLSLISSLALLVGSASAQWTKSIAVNSVYDNNAFRNYESIEDYVTRMSAYIARDLGGERWQSRLFYRGDYNVFANYADRNYHSHQVGVALGHQLGDRGDLLNLGANAGLRDNRDLYSYYDFIEAAGFGNIKLHFGASTPTTFGYRVQGRWYSNLPEFSNVEHRLFARLTHSFPTRTTLFLVGEFGRKIYLEQSSILSAAPEDGGTYGRHSGGMGRMWRSGGTGGTGALESRYSVGQWTGQLRLAQSLASTTGLSAEVLVRRNPQQNVRYLAGQVSGYSSEDELFDDRYGYEDEEIRGTLTELLPWGVTLKTGAERLWKDYVNRPALDLAGEALPSGEWRTDRQTVLWVSLSKAMHLGRGGPNLTLFGEIYRMVNDSNDDYYRFSAVTYAIGLSSDL